MNINELKRQNGKNIQNLNRLQLRQEYENNNKWNKLKNENEEIRRQIDKKNNEIEQKIKIIRVLQSRIVKLQNEINILNEKLNVNNNNNSILIK